MKNAMKHTCKTLDYEALTCLTGDPFVDAGGFVLEELSKWNPGYDIMDLIMLATQIYVDCWDAKINTFFLNSKITQTGFNTADKKNETERYFKELLDDTAPHIEGYCRVTGRKTNLYPAGRNNSVLSGSGAFVNFHHSFESGIMLSKEVLIRFHFLPLACEQMQGKIGVISSSNPVTAAFYAKRCCSKILYDVGKNQSKGVLKNDSRSPGTALFRFLDYLLSELNPTKDEQLTLYHFTNFGPSPEAQVYTLPFPTFQFYRETKRPAYADCWKKFVAAHYRTTEFKNASYQMDRNVFLVTDKKELRTLKEHEFQYWSNLIYNKLMRNQSIVKEIRKWSVEQ
ncbi:CRISPR-associated protein, partial [gut metagenome]